MKEKRFAPPFSLAGVLVTIGIVYGDIGTSPLYVMAAIVGDKQITKELVLGGLSCVFWTITLQATIKYQILTLRAHNKGEGGVLSLFALIRRRAKNLIIPAIIGGSALLADGIITPAISVTSAIEGFQMIYPNFSVVPVVIAILTLLFLFQQFGTNIIGRSFGPLMLVWFGMLAVLGAAQLPAHWEVLRAVNPKYAIDFLIKYPGGFWILGAVFLCATGGEALYSDLGHCGAKNIQTAWIFVKTALLLNYFGQGAYLLSLDGTFLEGKIPFFSIMPPWFLLTGVVIATVATIIASQALITGSYTLINEAIKLDFWPKMKVKYPTETRGQMYVPVFNWMLWAGCIFIILYFQTSLNMVAAYGVAISIAMMMTTVLISRYFVLRNWPVVIVFGILFFFLSIEASFFIANMHKFAHGGWVTLVITGLLALVMGVWYKSRQIKDRLIEYASVDDYLPTLKELSNDTSVPKYATHLIYMTSSLNPRLIDTKVIYSIFQKQPKRADIYWFIHVEVTDDPYTMKYKVHHLVPNDVIRIDLKLGFRVPQHINLLFRKVVEDLVKNKEVDITSRYASLQSSSIAGDFRFVVLESYLSNEYAFPVVERFILYGYFLLKKISLSAVRAFGLDTSSVKIEKVPLTFSATEKPVLERIE